MKFIALAGAGLALAGGIALVVKANRGPDRMAYRDAAVVVQGAELYASHCASCHGADLAGEPDWQTRDTDGYLPAPPHDEDGHTWHHPDDQLFEIVKYGTAALIGNDYRSKMAGFGEVLSDAEIRSVLAYIKSTWPARIIERHDEMNSAFDAAR